MTHVFIEATCVRKFALAAFMEALNKFHLAIMGPVRDSSAEFLKLYLNIGNVVGS